MPFNSTQLALGANYQLELYSKKDPVDQINVEHPHYAWLLKHKQETTGGNAYFNERIRISNDSNYQNYWGDDQVSYNRKDTVRLAKFPWANFHDGFGINEDDLAANNIVLNDDHDAVATEAEEVQITNIMKENYFTLKAGVQDAHDLELLLDGSTNSKAIPGLDYLVSTTPAVGTVGGIDAVSALYWRNNTSLAIAATVGLLTNQMELMWRACMLYGMRPPNKIEAGSTFIDRYRAEFQATVVRQAQTGGKALPQADVGTMDLAFHGVPIEWNMSFDRLDAILGAITYPWAKRCYFLNSNSITLRPLKGHWMINRKPPRMYDRYIYYFGMTSKYRCTINQRNCNAVLSVV